MPSEQEQIIVGMELDGWILKNLPLADGTRVLIKRQMSSKMYIPPSGQGILMGESHAQACLLDRGEILHYKNLGKNRIEAQKAFDF
jgi:hypothetical protein